MHIHGKSCAALHQLKIIAWIAIHESWVTVLKNDPRNSLTVDLSTTCTSSSFSVCSPTKFALTSFIYLTAHGQVPTETLWSPTLTNNPILADYLSCESLYLCCLIDIPSLWRILTILSPCHFSHTHRWGERAIAKKKRKRRCIQSVSGGNLYSFVKVPPRHDKRGMPGEALHLVLIKC